MIEYVTISLLVLGALMVGLCLRLFAARNQAFWCFQPKRWRCQNWTAHHQLCIRLHAVMCLNITYMCFVDEFACGCFWVGCLGWGCRIGGEGVAGWAGRPARRTRRNPNGGVGGEPAMGEDSKSGPWALTTLVWRERRPAEGAPGDPLEWPPPPPPRRCDCCRPPPPPSADMKGGRLHPRDRAVVLRGAPPSCRSSGAG